MDTLQVTKVKVSIDLTARRPRATSSISGILNGRRDYMVCFVVAKLTFDACSRLFDYSKPEVLRFLL